MTDRQRTVKTTEEEEAQEAEIWHVARSLILILISVRPFIDLQTHSTVTNRYKLTSTEPKRC